MSNENGNILFHQIFETDKNQGNDVKRVVNPPTVSYPSKKAYSIKPASQESAPAVNKGKMANSRVESKMTPETETKDDDFELEFTSKSMMNGIILSELLGKPKILQKRRW